MERDQGNPSVVNMIYRGFALSAEVLSKRDISLIYHIYLVVSYNLNNIAQIVTSRINMSNETTLF